MKGIFSVSIANNLGKTGTHKSWITIQFSTCYVALTITEWEPILLWFDLVVHWFSTRLEQLVQECRVSLT